MLLQRLLRFRYSLRALLVFITLLALWGGYHANRGWKEGRAVAVLLEHGADVTYWSTDWRLRPFGFIPSAYWGLVGWLWGDR
jgi:hypothetical protein